MLAHAMVEKHIPESRVLRRVEAREDKMRRSDEHSATGGPIVIQPSDLVEQIRQTNPALLNGISPPEAERLIRNMFKNMSEQLEGTEGGVVSFAGLGRFRVNRIERDVNGGKVMQRRIVFRPAGGGKGSA
jgi:nucleoid DNA-binding protein